MSKTVVGELGILIGLAAGIAAESCEDFASRIWLVALVFVELVMAFIGEAASKQTNQLRANEVGWVSTQRLRLEQSWDASQPTQRCRPANQNPLVAFDRRALYVR